VRINQGVRLVKNIFLTRGALSFVLIPFLLAAWFPGMHTVHWRKLLFWLLRGYHDQVAGLWLLHFGSKVLFIGERPFAYKFGLFVIFNWQVGFYYNFGVDIIIILWLLIQLMRLLWKIMLLRHPTIWIELLSPAIGCSKCILILIEIRLAEIDLWLMIEVELGLAFIALNRLLWETTGALRVAVVPDHLLLAFSHLQQRVDVVEPLRVLLHHEQAVLVKEFLVRGNWFALRPWGRMGSWGGVRVTAWGGARTARFAFGCLFFWGDDAVSTDHAWSPDLYFDVAAVFDTRFLFFAFGSTHVSNGRWKKGGAWLNGTI
jgi:hypothetical protein